MTSNIPMPPANDEMIPKIKRTMGHKADGVRAHMRLDKRKTGPLGEVIGKLKK